MSFIRKTSIVGIALFIFAFVIGGSFACVWLYGYFAACEDAKRNSFPLYPDGTLDVSNFNDTVRKGYVAYISRHVDPDGNLFSKNPPIKASYRTGFLSDYVLKLANLSGNEDLDLDVTIWCDAERMQKSFELNRFAEIELGSLELDGWGLARGHSGVVVVKGYPKVLQFSFEGSGTLKTQFAVRAEDNIDKKSVRNSTTVVQHDGRKVVEMSYCARSAYPGEKMPPNYRSLSSIEWKKVAGANQSCYYYDSDGYFNIGEWGRGRLLVNDVCKRIVLAWSGTDVQKDANGLYQLSSAGTRDIVTIINAYLLGSDERLDRALDFAKAVLEAYRGEMWIVGHSLGGMLTTYTALQLNYDGRNVSFATFNGLGVPCFMEVSSPMYDNAERSIIDVYHEQDPIHKLFGWKHIGASLCVTGHDDPGEFVMSEDEIMAHAHSIDTLCTILEKNYAANKCSSSIWRIDFYCACICIFSCVVFLAIKYGCKKNIRTKWLYLCFTLAGIILVIVFYDNVIASSDKEGKRDRKGTGEGVLVADNTNAGKTGAIDGGGNVVPSRENSCGKSHRIDSAKIAEDMKKSAMLLSKTAKQAWQCAKDGNQTARQDKGVSTSKNAGENASQNAAVNKHDITDRRHSSELSQAAESVNTAAVSLCHSMSKGWTIASRSIANAIANTSEQKHADVATSSNQASGEERAITVSRGWPNYIRDSILSAKKIAEDSQLSERQKTVASFKIRGTGEMVQLHNGVVKNVSFDAKTLSLHIEGLDAKIEFGSTYLRDWAFWIDIGETVSDLNAEIIEIKEDEIYLGLSSMKIGKYRISSNGNGDTQRPCDLPYATMTGDDVLSYVSSKRSGLSGCQQRCLEEKLRGRVLTFRNGTVDSFPRNAVLGAYRYSEIVFGLTPKFEIEIQLRAECNSSAELQKAFNELSYGDKIDSFNGEVRVQVSYDENFLPVVLKSITVNGKTFE